MVVDDVGEVIGGQVVGTLVEDFVVEDVRFDVHLVAQEVVDLDEASGLNLEAHHILLAVGDEALDFFGGEGQGVAHRHTRRGVVLEVGHFRALGLELLRGVEGDVSLAGVEEHFDVLAVDVTAFALLVGAVGASFADALVDADAQPCQGLVDVILGAGHETL